MYNTLPFRDYAACEMPPSLVLPKAPLKTSGATGILTSLFAILEYRFSSQVCKDLWEDTQVQFGVGSLADTNASLFPRD